MKAMKEFLEFYLTCHVLLLADVFEKYMNNGLKSYGLCLGHYLSIETLNWDLNYISKGYSKANEKYLRSFNPNQELKQIIYLDRNNLCGYSMSKFLPAGTFKWIH